MESCCSLKAAEAVHAARCPKCEEAGRSVERITLEALLRPEALMRLAAGPYRFCPAADCDVVYFAAASVFLREDLAVPVFQKEPPGERTVCYCFDVTEADLRREIAGPNPQESTAAARITAFVKADRCACEVRNPQGTCCLGNVAAVTKALRAEVVPTL